MDCKVVINQLWVDLKDITDPDFLLWLGKRKSTHSTEMLPKLGSGFR